VRNFGRKNRFQTITESPIILGILFIIVLIFAWNVFGFWGKMRETAKNKALAQSKLENLMVEKEKLTADIGKLDTKAGVEESIRDKFGYGKEGEELIVIVNDEKKLSTGGEEKGGFWAHIKGWFK
jgi:cell division protein FtsB